MPTNHFPTSRVRFIDATRGMAMILVLLSHFAQVFVLPDGLGRRAISRITVVATPTFVLLSGVLLGFMYVTRADRFSAFRTKLVDRGLFLLTIGHTLVLLSHLTIQTNARWLFITDVIAVSIFVGPILVVRLRPRARLVLSLALYATAWAFVAAWHPIVSFDEMIKETLFGSLTPNFYSYAFPLLPWFSLYLGSTVLGQHLGTIYKNGDLDKLSRLLGALAIGACLLAIGITVGAKLLVDAYFGGTHSVADLGFALRSVDQKYPPSPVFLLFHGGIGLGLLCVCLWAERRGRAAVVVANAVALGQCSLFIYILQYYIYYTALHFLRPYLPFQWAWPLYFVASAALIIRITLEWHRRGFNRYMTVGYETWRAHGAAALSLRLS